MKNLIGMVDFVLLGWNDIAILRNYANFLKQPLELWMFVPCDENGDVLEVVPYYADGIEKVNEYKKAKERCLFDGFKYNDGYLINGMNCINTKLHQTIEDLVKYKPLLTAATQKQLSL